MEEEDLRILKGGSEIEAINVIQKFNGEVRFILVINQLIIDHPVI